MTKLTGEFEITGWDEATYEERDGGRLEGSIEGRHGSAVVESIGDFDGKKAKGRWSVVPGSGTDGWTGMKGKGRFVAPLGPKATFTLDCEFAD